MAASGTKDMTIGNPARLIFFYAIPILIGNIFQQFYSMVDTIIVGKYIGSDALAGVGLTGPLNFFVLGFTIGITGGFSVIVAQRFGAKDEEGLKRSVATILALCVAITIIITIVAVAMTGFALRSINTPVEVYRYSYEYIVVIFAGIGATILYNMLAGLLRAIGNSRTPLYFLLIASFLNIVLDLLFVIVFKLETAGAAYATVISQAVSGILCLLYIKRKYPILHIGKKDFVPDVRFALSHMKIGLPMAFQFSITAIGAIILQGALNLLGASKIAAFTTAVKAEQLFTQPAGTFGVTMANYTGQNLGANRIDRIKEGVRKCTVIALCFSMFASLMLAFYGKYIVRLFIKADTADFAVIFEYAQKYFNIIIFFFPFLFMLFIFRNVLQGSGHSFMPFMAGVLELFARSLAAKLLPPRIDFYGICLAGPIAWVAAAVFLCFAYMSVMKKMTKKVEEDGRSS